MATATKKSGLVNPKGCKYSYFPDSFFAELYLFMVFIKGPLGRGRHRWVNNIKISPKETDCEKM
jgi:hypothetical protein